MTTTTKPYLGIALSGGTLKAAAHIGVLGALEKVGIEPDAIAGTSAGSFVSALYAHGYRDEQFTQLLQSFPGMKLVDYGFPLWSSLWSLTLEHMPGRGAHRPYVPSGLLRGHRLIRYIERLLTARRLQIPLYIVAVDLVSGRPVVFSSEDSLPNRTYVKLTNISRAIAGSCALPGIFTPVVLDPYILVDGAMRDYVPVNVLQDIGCQKIIAINLYRLPTNYEPRTLIDILARSFDILLRESIDHDIVSGPNTYLLEPDLSNIRWRKFSQMNECFAIGRKLVDDKRNDILTFVHR